MINLDTALTALKVLFSSKIRGMGKIVLKEYGKGIQPASVFTGPEELTKILEQSNRRQNSLAVGIAVRHPEFSILGGSQGRRADCIAVETLKVDFDAHKTPAGLKLALSEKLIECVYLAIKRAPVYPSMIVESGGGLHAYYRLNIPALLADEEIVPRIESLNQAIMSYFEDLSLPCKIDTKVKDISRIMRLPGSVNFGYDSPRPVSILETSDYNYSLEELEKIFKRPQEQIGKKEKAKIKQVPKGDFINLERTTLLGDKITIFSLQDLAKRCPAIRGLIAQQVEKGVCYDIYFKMARLLAQFNIDELPHDFARLNPLYSKDYDHSPQGRIHTQSIIDETKAMYKQGKAIGYITYGALGLNNECKHSNFSCHTSPARHLIAAAKSISRFVIYSPINGKKTFSSQLAADEVIRNHNLIYLEHECLFYKYIGPIWKKQTDSAIRAIIKEVLGEDCEPEHTRKTFQTLADTNTVGTNDFFPHENIVAFKNGFLDLDCFLKSTKYRNKHSSTELEDLNFTLFASLTRDKIKSMNLVTVIDADFNPDAEAKEFEKYLATTFGSDVNLISFAKELAGYCIIPHYPIHAFFVLMGPGGNGKGVFLQVLVALAGKQNVCHMDFANFNRFSTANLQHKLLNVSDELPKNANWELLKRLSGGSYTEAEQKHKASFNFKSTAKMVFSCNEYPDFTDHTPAFWTRIQILPFMASFRGTSAEISNYEEILTRELDGIALWALRGLITLLKRGHFPRTSGTQAAKDEARMETDFIQSFIKDRCIEDIRLGEFTDHLFCAYQCYCEANNFKYVNSKKFLAYLLRRGVSKSRDASTFGGETVNPRKHFMNGIGYDRSRGESDFRKNRHHKFGDSSVFEFRPFSKCRDAEQIITAVNQGATFECSSCSQKECKVRIDPPQ